MKAVDRTCAFDMRHDHMPWKRREVPTNIAEKEREMYTLYAITNLYNAQYHFTMKG